MNISGEPDEFDLYFKYGIQSISENYRRDSNGSNIVNCLSDNKTAELSGEAYEAIVSRL